jgi:Kef-type K+ transport system membrane component KefB
MQVLIAQAAAPALTSGQVLAFVLFGVALILVLARIMGSLAKRVGQPAVVGEILAGILLGPTLLGPAIFKWETPWAFLNCQAANPGIEELGITHCLFPMQARGVLGILGQVALLLFMFLVGLEFDFDLLKGKVKSVLIVGLGVVAIPVAIGLALNPVLFNETFAHPDASRLGFGLMVGAMLSVTAFPVMVRILQEKGLTLSPMGSVGIAAAAVCTILMFVTVSMAGGIARGDESSVLLRNLALTAVYIAVMAFVVRPLLKPLGARYEARVSQLGGPVDEAGWSDRDEFAPSGVGWALTHHMFAIIMILVFTSGWIAHVLGINVIVGGFMAGIVLPARKGLIRDMTNELFDLTAIILLPIFLAFSGLATDFTQLRVAALAGIAVFLVAGIASKWGGGAILGRLGGMSWAEGNVLGILMNCRGLLVLVVALIGIQTNVITPAMQLGGVLMALVTTMMTGPLFDKFIAKVRVPDTPADMMPREHKPPPAVAPKP